MNIKQFYNEQKKKESDEFSQKTGLRIRDTIQRYNDGSDCEEVFALRIPPHKEFWGVEFHGCIFYLLPVNRKDSLLALYDDSFMPILETLSELSAPYLAAYSRYAHSLMSAIDNAQNGLFAEFGVFFDEDMLCFAKQIHYPLVDKISEGYIVEPELIAEAISIVQFRNQCQKEIASFSGFSSKEKKEIAFKEGLSFVKKSLRIMRLVDYLPNNE